MGKLKQTLHSVLFSSLFLGAGSLLYGAPPQKGQPSQPAPPASDAGASTVEASRYVGADVENFVQELLPTLGMANRTTDPFGRLQDPEAKPIVQAPSITNPQSEPQVPFSEIISLIQINTVMAGDRRFLVGSRTFSQGDQFPLNFRGKQVRIQIIEVSSRQIQFKNLETGEVAAHKLNLLPAGMRAGQNGITAPGMVPSGRDVPLEIEPADQAPSGSPTR
jgi:hypothetical protein